MKKLISCIMALTLMLSVFTPASASYGICAEVLNTDIKAYIDGMPIKSYNINGWTGVVAEDLREYGFFVDWYPEERALYVSKNELSDEITADYRFEENIKPIGSHAKYVYNTDIKTYVDGREVTAFNIDGWTIIYIDELQVFGDVIWYPEAREITYTYSRPWSISILPSVLGNTARHKSEADDGIGYVKAYLENKSDTGYSVNGENLEHLSWMRLEYSKRLGGLRLGLSMIAEHLLADELSELLSKMETVEYDGTRLKENADVANENVKITINGSAVPIKDVKVEKGNNHLDYIFILDFDVAEEEIKTISFECGVSK